MGLRLVFVRRMCAGFGQGMGCVSNWVRTGCGCSGRCVYVLGHCIVRVQELVLVYMPCSPAGQGTFHAMPFLCSAFPKSASL